MTSPLVIHNMELSLTPCILLLVWGAGAWKMPDPIVTVMAPYTIREHTRYTAAVTVERWEKQSPVFVQVNIGNLSTSTVFRGDKRSELQTVSVAVGAILGDWNPFEERGLVVKAFIRRVPSRGRIKFFERKRPLHVSRKTRSVSVYTDRQVYKPGDVLQFRVLALDRHLRPTSTTVDSIKLLDARQNTIRLWHNVTVDRYGLFSDSVQLGTQLVLGRWNLIVSDPASSKTGIIEHQLWVIEYILPKFGVKITTSRPFFVVGEASIEFTVKSTYTYGAPVQGRVSGTIEWIDCQVGKNLPPKVFNQTMRLSKGKAHFAFAVIPEIQDLNYECNVNMTATVQEDLTGLEYGDTSKLGVYPKPFQIKLVDMEPFYTLHWPPINVKVRVTAADGGPIPILDTVTLQYVVNRPDGERWVRTLNAATGVNGTASFRVPADDGLDYRFNISFRSVSKSFYFPKVYTPEEEQDSAEAFIVQEIPKRGRHTVTTLIEFSLQPGGGAAVGVNWVVVSRSDGILRSGRAQLIPNSGSASAKIELDINEWASDRNLHLVAFSAGQRQFKTQARRLRPPALSQSQMSMQLSTPLSEPGDNVTLTLYSRPGALVALRAVDYSVLLLGGDEDLDFDAITYEALAFEEADGRLPGESSYEPLREINVLLMTNAVECTAEDDCGVDHVCWRHKCESGLAGGGGWAGGYRPGLPQPKLRTRFPETWLWDVVEMNGSSAELTLQVPDTITSWVISGVSLHPGRAIAPALPQTLRAVRPFFVTLNLPYSLVKGETVAVQVLVHNHLGKNVDAEVQLAHNALELDLRRQRSGNASDIVQVSVSSGAIESVFFDISPKALGTIKLNFTATCGMAADAISQSLLVRPPGQKMVKSKSSLLRIDTKRSVSEAELTFETEFPPERVAGSDSVSISAVGDILGPALASLDRLLRTPTGRGEENLAHFASTTVVLKYLTATGALTPEIKAKATRLLEIGYQRQLTYAHSDGSFSEFGDHDNDVDVDDDYDYDYADKDADTEMDANDDAITEMDADKERSKLRPLAGSTSLTASVVRAFHAAKPFINVDQRVLEKALKFLKKRQLHDGRFEELQPILTSEIVYGGGDGPLELTAHTLMAFADASGETHTHVKRAAFQYLQGASDMGQIGPHTFFLFVLALTREDHALQEEFIQQMDNLAIQENRGEMMHWEGTTPGKVSVSSNSSPSAGDIEVTAYALLTYILADRVAEALPIVKWLVSQQNPSGIFVSTRDTVAAITALAAYAEKTTSLGPGSINVTIRTRGKGGDMAKVISATVDSDNSIVLQEFPLPPETRSVEFVAKGHGQLVVKFTYTYWVDGTVPIPDGLKSPYQLVIKLESGIDGHESNNNTSGHLELSTCVYSLKALEKNESFQIQALAVMQVNLPTGYAFNPHHIQEVVEGTGRVQRHELSNADTTLDIFLESVTAECFALRAAPVFSVWDHAPAYVHVYEYYNPSARASVAYSVAQPGVSIFNK